MPILSTSLPEFRVSAKSLAIDLLSTMPSHFPVAVGALLRGAAVLGIGENSMRVALARLRARGLVETDERGLYRLSSIAEPVNRRVRSWRSIEQGVVEWDGSWMAVEMSGLPRGDRKRSRMGLRALRLLGFEALTPGLQIRPDNLVGGVGRVGGVGEVRKRLLALGFAPVPMAFKLTDLDSDLDARARSLWDVATLEAGYRASRERLEESTERLSSLSEVEAMAETFRLGGEAVRRIVLDPLLPESIVDVPARRALVEAMQRYDILGRDCWKGWAGESVVLERSPAEAGGLAAVAGSA
jgi:phenylacetic acid degradation operon negative regulatory protein